MKHGQWWHWLTPIFAGVSVFLMASRTDSLLFYITATLLTAIYFAQEYNRRLAYRIGQAQGFLECVEIYVKPKRERGKKK